MLRKKICMKEEQMRKCEKKSQCIYPYCKLYVNKKKNKKKKKKKKKKKNSLHFLGIPKNVFCSYQSNL